jgi:hypothetical protein
LGQLLLPDPEEEENYNEMKEDYAKSDVEKGLNAGKAHDAALQWIASVQRHFLHQPSAKDVLEHEPGVSETNEEAVPSNKPTQAKARDATLHMGNTVGMGFTPAFLLSNLPSEGTYSAVTRPANEQRGLPSEKATLQPENDLVSTKEDANSKEIETHTTKNYAQQQKPLQSHENKSGHVQPKSGYLQRRSRHNMNFRGKHGGCLPVIISKAAQKRTLDKYQRTSAGDIELEGLQYDRTGLKYRLRSSRIPGGSCFPSRARPVSAATPLSSIEALGTEGVKGGSSSVQVHAGGDGHGWGRAKYSFEDGAQTVHGQWPFNSNVPLASQQGRRSMRKSTQVNQQCSKGSPCWRDGNFSAFGPLPLAASLEYHGTNAAKCKPQPHCSFLETSQSNLGLRLQTLRTSKVILDQPLRPLTAE